jgi:hypothetical protein
MKLTEAKIIEQRVAYNQLVESICKGMDTSQRKTILEAKASARNINRVLREAQLSTAQINALFGAVEQNATASGSNRTIVGKGKDVVDAVNDGIAKVGKALQNTAPVKAFDQKFEQLKGSVSAKFPELEKQLSSIGEYAKQNPGKTQAIVTVLTILAGVATGGVGGAIAGQLLRGSLELVKGEKLSTAIGKGLKTAAIGYITGVLADKVGSFFSDAGEGVTDVSGSIEGSDVIDQASSDAGLTNDEFIKQWASRSPEQFKIVQSNELMDHMMSRLPGNVYPPAEMMDKIRENIIIDGDFASGNFTSSIDGNFVRGNIFLTSDEAAQFEQLFQGTDVFNPEATQWLADNVEGAARTIEVSQAASDAASQAWAATATDAQKAARAATMDMMSKDNSTGNPVLSESDIFKLFTAVAYKQPLVESQYVDEAPIGDMIKKAGSAVAGAAKSAAGAAGDAIKKGASAVAQQAATTGKNITTKVTVDKLMTAWKKAGSPNNDAKMAQFLAGFGIEPRAVQAAFKTAKLDVPKDIPMDQVEVIVSQTKQNSKLKDAIIAYLEGPTKRTPDTGLGQQPQTATA